MQNGEPQAGVSLFLTGELLSISGTKEGLLLGECFKVRVHVRAAKNKDMLAQQKHLRFFFFFLWYWSLN
jgi:hypothetical protein